MIRRAMEKFQKLSAEFRFCRVITFPEVHELSETTKSNNMEVYIPMNNDDFIMSPKVDFAFKEIMFNEKVRKGFLSAVLEIPVSKIKKTVLKNTNL